MLNRGYPTPGILAPEIPVDHLSAFIFQQEGYSWAGRPLLRDTFKDWVLKDRMVRVEAINHERAGGVPYANAPQGATPAEIEDLDQLMQQFRIGETAGAALPFGSELKIAKGSGSDIDRTIKRYDESMARRFLLQLMNLAQGGQNVGSYALSENFEDFFLVGQRAIAQWYCDTVNEHIIEDIVDWNYGEDEDLVPKLTWERTSEDSLGVDGLATLVQRGVIVVDDEVENAIRYKYQLPKRSEPRGDQIVTPGGPRQPTQEQADKTPALIEDKDGPDAGAQAGAPSSAAPATASFGLWDRLRGRKPDVQAKTMATPALVTVPNVEILHAGIEYNLSTGPTTFTPEDLRDAVMAANEDPSIPNPRLKLGHVDPRFNDEKMFDATPSFGKATNLRLSENGMAVYADYVGVPKWLAEIMPTAFPSRSIEGYWNVESQMGKNWRFVLSACSLLGVVWPGVTVLEDLPQYYGETMPSDVQVVAAATEATGGDPEVKLFGKKGTAASANLDDVRRAFYNEYLDDNPEYFWWWIQAILVDPNELVVEDDESGNLYKLAFETDADGNVSFGDPERVRIEYVPDTRDANKAAAAHVAATLAVGRDVAASWSKREDSVLPKNTTAGGKMDPKEIRSRLGLPEDASDEQVQETLRGLNEAAGIEVTQEVPAPTTTTTTTTEVTPAATTTETTEPAAPAVAPAAVAAAGLPAGMVVIDEATLKTLQVGASAGLEAKTKSEEQERSTLVAAAIGDGRIAPASREHWTNLLKNDPTAKETLASLQKGLIPVEMREIGQGGHGVDGDGAAAAGDLSLETVHGWSGQLFPEVRAQQEREAARAAGQSLGRSRIVSDGSYTR